jgi:hypothetical protein
MPGLPCHVLWAQRRKLSTPACPPFGESIEILFALSNWQAQ